MKFIKMKVGFIFYMILFIQPAFATQLRISEDDPIYSFLLMMENKGLLEYPLPATRPWIQDEVAQHLKNLQQKSDKLNRTESNILQMFVNRYRMELSDLKHPILSESDSVHVSPKHLRQDLKRKVNRSVINEPDYMFLYEKEEQFVFVQGDGLVRYENKNDLFRFSGHVGFRTFGQFDNVSVFGEAMAYRLFVRDGFRDDPIDSRGFYLHADSSESLVSFDNTTGYIQIAGKGGLFTLGNDPVRWGLGENTMFLSGQTANYPYIMWQKALYKFRYTFLHASLMNAVYSLSDDGHSKIYPEKYMTGHRLEIYPHKSLSFAFTELLTYGYRHPDLTYFIPVSFLWSAEHNLEDRDNSLLGFDIKWRLAKGVQIYGCILLDEFKFGELTSEWWGNKRGYQIGTTLSLPGKILWETFFEGTLIRPWTYTHYLTVNTFTHKGDCLGFHTGPNTRVYTAGIRGWINESHTFKIAFQSIEKGKEPLPPNHPDYYPVGSDPNQNYYDRNKDFDFSTKNLMGEIEQTI
ncbi:MAG TPA: hypothetical protein ENO01_01180, partial [Candidatus Marinimicrobia bacterium]|nr:hypothetical protein [Candidatus Neomarinimicrobiota bacterium]